MTTARRLVNIRKNAVNGMKALMLEALRASTGYVSGQALSRQLGVSRVSIWKHIRSLKEDGYVIDAAPRGYKLISSPDLLFPWELPEFEDRIRHFRELGSTMDVARELAKRGAAEGTIVIAEVQTGGRGRLSREWVSPKGGIYFTIILRPRISPAYAPRANLMACLAVARTIRKLFGIEAGLKWPNDVMVGGKKVCGILAEMDAEMDVVNFVNIGIGVNVNNSVRGLEDRATSLKDLLGRTICRKEFLSKLLEEMERWLPLLMKSDLLEEWKRLSVTLGKEVRVESPDEVIAGRAIDIDVSGALIVRDKDGSVKKAIAGDCIHLREAGPKTSEKAAKSQ